MTYSVDFRKRELKIKDKEKLSFEVTAKRFGISKTTLCSWTKNIEPQKKRNRKAVKIDMEALRKDIELYPDRLLLRKGKKIRS